MRIRSRFMKGISKARLIATDSTRIKSRFPANSCICTENLKLRGRHTKYWQCVKEAYVSGGSEKLGQTSGMICPHQNNKEIYVNIFRPPALSFRHTVQQSVDFSPFDFYVCGHLKVLLYSAAIDSEKRHFTDAFSMPVKPPRLFSNGTTGPSWCQWIFRSHKVLPIALWDWGRLSL